jgi:hypothetical protein
MEQLALASPSGTPVGLGVSSIDCSPAYYCYRLGNTYTATSIPRTSGWHQFVFDYRSGNDVKLYIDGTLVATSTAACSFNSVQIGDTWPGSRQSTCYYDDVSVQDNLPWEPVFSDGFENGFGNWLTYSGTSAASSTIMKSGDKSFVTDENADCIGHRMGAEYNKVCSVWFRDNASVSSMEEMIFAGTIGMPVGLGVNSFDSSSSYYCYRIGQAYTATNVPRTTGWHQFVFDYRSGADVKLYIDGALVATSTAASTFNSIQIGDTWQGVQSTCYYDDVCVQDNLPWEPVSFDGFENGFGDWTALCGTPATNTSAAHTGNCSFVTNEDQDCISKGFSANINKVCTVWFYDNTSYSTIEQMAFASSSNLAVGLGVSSIDSSSTYYCYRIGSTYTATNIARSTGWHQFVFDYRSGTDVKLYIDGTPVATSAAATSLRSLQLGDTWPGNRQSTCYYDDISIQDILPW